MNKIGEYNTLEVYKEVDFGIYLKKRIKLLEKSNMRECFLIMKYLREIKEVLM